MKSRTKAWSLIAIILVSCIVMAYVDAVIRPNYAVKSVIKMLLFLTLPIGYALMGGGVPFRKLFNFEKKGLLASLLLGAGVFAFILASYALIGPLFDFSRVTGALQQHIGVNAGNFVFVAIYISFVNSLLEEFFFRGFAFFTLKDQVGRTFAYLFSAGAFAVYHIAMMTSWFTLPLFLLLIASLFIAGLLFNWLNERNGNIYASWMVHLCANLAINTIGFILFDII
ncbi:MULTISPECIES: CPBP family intramembrane glutamic endopeptidase [Paenibacillus]|uniref:Abortive infection protein n=3 Tax=Paenibacillus TaxID=44249 RepID=G4HID8_9BACL|nr:MULTISPECIES: CPBP family intramembrane glutamic endopeptidase [Paenibacillus]EHB63111.1 Abortive infection protein [Paenibacillus lactis 154]MBP1894840.1 membrane protease YdiL (CAAX protease family) [Paenibacillus lactis]MCM3495916.1 CPBP family intramembrane metalloprotease [Paenibacillus lactis]GIO92730.1 CAAX amino protease [Paenibacillus lactis]HAG00301.1 CPBP family intramembrane metalloprotease [Paenibacillus lactis]